MKPLSKINYRAVELLSAGTCNLNCKYCYIPKNKELIKIHESIIKKIETGDYIEDIKKLMPIEKIRTLAFWGTEPSLTFDNYIKILPILFRDVPNLEGFSMSSNYMTNLDFYKRYIEAISKMHRKKKKFELSIQCSLDGPPSITDTNRSLGSADKIRNNLISLITWFNESDINNILLETPLKVTLSVDNMRFFLEDKERLIEFFEFFNSISKDLITANSKHKVIANGYQHPSYTVEVPGTYTSEDGRDFHKFYNMYNDVLKLQMKKRKFKYLNRIISDVYYNRYSRSLYYDYGFDSFSNSFQTTCSAGKSCMAIDDEPDVHLCHRTLFLNKKEYVDNVLEQDNISSTTKYAFSSPLVGNLVDNFVINASDDMKLIASSYVSSWYHYNSHFRRSSVFSMIKSLLKCGQVSKAYENDILCVLACNFLECSATCPVEDILNTGSIHLYPISLFRFFFNGVFEEIVKKSLENKCQEIGGYC